MTALPGRHDMYGACRGVHSVAHASVRIDGQHGVEFSALAGTQRRHCRHDARRELVVSACVQFNDHTRAGRGLRGQIFVGNVHWTCQCEL